MWIRVAGGNECPASFPRDYEQALGEMRAKVRKVGLSPRKHVRGEYAQRVVRDIFRGGYVVDSFDWEVSVTQAAYERLRDRELIPPKHWLEA